MHVYIKMSSAEFFTQHAKTEVPSYFCSSQYNYPARGASNIKINKIFFSCNKGFA